MSPVRSMINRNVIHVACHVMDRRVQTVFCVHIMLIIVAIATVFVRTTGQAKTVRIIKVHVTACV